MSIRALMGKSYRDPHTNKVYQFVDCNPDPDAPDLPENEHLGEVTVVYDDGTRHTWFGHEVEDDCKRRRLEPISP